MKKIRLTTTLLALGLTLTTTACSGKEAKTSDVTKAPAEILTGEIKGEITVACYDAAIYQTFLEETAKLFEEKYPGTKVNIESFSEMPVVKNSEQDGEQKMIIYKEDDPQGRANYISKTSTALMSGKGADLLAMDVLPTYKYVESGQLENLREYMDQDTEFNKSDYRENIMNGLEFQNGTWFMPLDYKFDYYTYDSTLMEGQSVTEFGVNQAFTLNQLTGKGKTAFNGSNQIFSSPAYFKDGNGDLFSQMFRENYKGLIDMEQKTANFEDGKFKELIVGIKEMADQGYIAKGLSKTMNSDDIRESADGNPTDRFLFKSKNNLSLIGDTYPESGLNLSFATSNAQKGIETDDEIAGIWSEEAEVIPFAYEMAFGMNSNSANKETSWAFLKFMLSYDIQSSPSTSLITLPIHNEARMDKAENLYGMLFTEGGELDTTQKQALKSYTDAVEEMTDQMNGFTIRDTVIEDMVIEEMAYFFDDSKTADEVCQVLQNKVELYLNE